MLVNYILVKSQLLIFFGKAGYCVRRARERGTLNRQNEKFVDSKLGEILTLTEEEHEATEDVRSSPPFEYPVQQILLFSERFYTYRESGAEIQCI